LREREKTFDELNVRKRQTNMDIKLLMQQIKTLEENIDRFSRFASLFEQKSQALQIKLQEERQQEIKVAEITKEITMIQQSIEELDKKIKEKEELKKKMDYLRGLNSWLSNKFLNLVLFTEKNVMLKLREEFSKLFTEWFSVLVPETLSARLSENFTPIILIK